jgi:23S rRNA (uracil1939-C5)-methyltransferase
MNGDRGPAPVRSGDRLELEITDLAWGGVGVGRIAGGFVILVQGALAGERVAARVGRVRRAHAEARCEAILRASPDRVEPPCAHYDVCGGCDLQHLAPVAQTASRRRQVGALLERIAGCAPGLVQEAVPAEGSGPYRFRMDFDRGMGPEGSPILGLHRRGAPTALEPVRECAILAAEGNHARDAIEAALRDAVPPAQVARVSIQVDPGGPRVLATLVLEAAPGPEIRDLARWIVDRNPGIAGVVGVWTPGAHGRPRTITLAGRDYLEIQVEEDRLRVPAGAFFQPNARGWRILRRQTIDLVDPGPADRILELYCGVGFFTLPLARRAATVAAVEGQRAAVLAARGNLARAGLVNARVVARDVAAAVPALLREGKFDAVLVDPPRAGLPGATARLLARSGIGRIIYVSCDPGTLARDLAILAGPDRYRVSRVVPIDLFPHSHHVECVARLDG